MNLISFFKLRRPLILSIITVLLYLKAARVRCFGITQTLLYLEIKLFTILPVYYILTNPIESSFFFFCVYFILIVFRMILSFIKLYHAYASVSEKVTDFIFYPI